jgi:hypothetical protein
MVMWVMIAVDDVALSAEALGLHRRLSPRHGFPTHDRRGPKLYLSKKRRTANTRRCS